MMLLAVLKLIRDHNITSMTTYSSKLLNVWVVPEFHGPQIF